MKRRGFLGLLFGAPVAAVVAPIAPAPVKLPEACAPVPMVRFNAPPAVECVWIRIKDHNGKSISIPVWK